MENFTYTKPAKEVIYNGQLMHSLLELKFILSVEDTHAWLREGLEIYYNDRSSETGIRGGLEKYTPDFLIRNWETKKALLIEIKPTEFDDRWFIKMRKQIVHQFLKEMQYDWEFKVIYEQDIVLTGQQLQKFKCITACKHATYQEWLCPQQMNSTMLCLTQYDSFVRNGVLSAASH